MILIRGINYNILIFQLYKSGVYQDEAKTWCLYKEINVFLGLEPNQKETYKTVVHASSSIFGIFNQPTIFLKVKLGVVG